MARVHEEVSTSQAGRRRGTPWEMLTTSNLVAAMSAEELRLFSHILVKISMETSDGTTTSICCWALLPRSIAGEAVPSFYQGTSCARTSELHSDFDGLQCTKLSLPAGHFTGGDMLHLHFEAWDRGPPVHVGSQSPASICEWAP